MAKGLMANKVDKSYLISDVYEQLLLIVIKGKFQETYWNVINFASMRWIQTKQGSKKWLESLHLCLDSSRSYKGNQKYVNLAFRRKQATLVY